MIIELNWQTKAKIMKSCALLPAGGGVFTGLFRRLLVG